MAVLLIIYLLNIPVKESLEIKSDRLKSMMDHDDDDADFVVLPFQVCLVEKDAVKASLSHNAPGRQHY